MNNCSLAAAVRQALRNGSADTVDPRYGYLVRALSALTMATLAASPAFAAEETELQEVTVTGSRIRQETGMTTPVPVTSVTTEDLKLSNPGASLVDQLDKLPQLFQTESAQRSSGALFGNAGGSYVNLRGLGSQRTLVLLDGSRVVQDDRGGTVNIGVFPTALIKKVDIVTGGASAQYGADAVGGVVNFVLDRDFTGLKASASTGVTEVGDGFNHKASIAGGFKVGENLHVVASAEYNHIDQIKRDPSTLGNWFQRYGFVTNPAFVSAAATPGVPVRLTLPNVISSVHSPTGRIDTAYPLSNVQTAAGVPFTLRNTVFLDDGSGVRPFLSGPVTSGSGGTQSMSGGAEFGPADAAFPGGPYGARVNEKSAFLGLKYDINDRVSVFGHALYGSSASDQLDQRGLPHLQDIWYATIYSGNPFLPASVQQAMTAQNVGSFKMLKLGQFLGANNWNDSEEPRNEHSMFTWSAGVEADLFSDWHLRATWQSGRSHKFTAVYDELRVDRMFLALDAVTVTAANVGTSGLPIGSTACNVRLTNPTPAQLAASVAGRLNKFGQPLLSPVGLDAISGCVPLDAFGQGNVSQAARDYLVGDKWGISNVHQDFAEALLTGKLFEGWAGPVSAALGVTYRAEDFKQRAYPDELERVGPPLNAPAIGIRGIPSGFTGGSPNVFQFSTVPPIQGEYDVKEVFAEVNVPVFKLESGQKLDADLAYRSSRYSNVGTVSAYKAGLDFTVYSDLRLRGTFSRDVREATFAERFDEQGSGGAVNDPNVTACRNLSGNPAAAAGCSVQITSVAVGNPGLAPEKADTITLGAVFRPSFIEGLQMSVDYYKVDVADAIGQLGFQRIVDDCFRNIDPALCAYVERDSASQVIGRVKNPYLNVAQTTVKGVDYEAQYTLHPEFIADLPETLTMRAFVSNILKRSNKSSDTAAVNRFDGGFTGGVLYPKWKGTMSMTYTFGKWDATLSEEWISKSKIDTTWVDTAAFAAGDRLVNGVTKTAPDVDDNWLPNYFNTNARFGYRGETASGHSWDVALFVTNLLDKHPMVIPSYNSRTGSQSVSNNYDAYGRRYELGFNFRY